MKTKQKIQIALIVLGVGIIGLILLVMIANPQPEPQGKKEPEKTVHPVPSKEKQPTDSHPIAEESSKASPSSADEEKWPLPPLEKRMEEYKDLGILDIKCGLDDMCKGEWGEHYSITALLTKDNSWGITAKVNLIASDGMALCVSSFNTTNIMKDMNSRKLRHYGYSSQGEWCSRLAQMYCDLGPSGRLNIKGSIDSEDNYMFYQEQAAKYLTVEGHASCVDEKLKQIMMQKHKR